MNEFKVIIAGGRDFDLYPLLLESADALLADTKAEVIVVSGTAKGADTLGEQYAQERGLTVKRFPAQWAEYGRSAGYKRNQEMAFYADALIACWDGESKGTKHMINIARKADIPVRIIRY